MAYPDSIQIVPCTHRTRILQRLVKLFHNLLFNTCRESGDHGAFNSWDRLPYVTDVRMGLPSTIPAYNEVAHKTSSSSYNDIIIFKLQHH